MRYPRCSTDRETAEKHNLEWVTPGHSLFEALRRHTLVLAQDAFAKGACFYSLVHETPARIDFYRARVVDGLSRVVHEQLFAVELRENNPPIIQEPGALSNLIPAPPATQLPSIAMSPEAVAWLNEHALRPFLDQVRQERQEEVDRIAAHVEVSLTELLQKVGYPLKAGHLYTTTVSGF